MQILKNKFTVFLSVLLVLSSLSFYYSNALYIKYIKYRISKEIHQISTDLKISIKNINIKRNFFQYFVTLENIIVDDEDANNHFHANEIFIHVKWKSIFSNMRFVKILISDSNLNINSTEKILLQFKPIFNKNSSSKLEFASDFFISFMNTTINRDRIDNGTIKFSNPKIHVSLVAEKSYENVLIDFENECCETFNAKFSNVNHLKKIINLFFKGNEQFFTSNLNLSGNLNINLNNHNPTIEGKISCISGNYTANRTFDIKEGSFSLSYSNGILFLDSVNLEIDKAKFVGTLEHRSNSSIVDGYLSNITMQNVQRFWPENIAPMLKGWLYESIKDGKFVSAYIFFDTKNSEFILEDVKFTDVSFAVPITKLGKKFMLQKSSGTFTLKSNKLNLFVEQAHVNKISTTFNLECIKAGNGYELNINGKSSSTIQEGYKNINEFIKLPLNAEYIDEKGTLNTSFLLLLQINKNGQDIAINEEISAEIKTLKAKNIFDIFNISSDSVKVNIKNKQIQVSSKAAINDNDVNLNGKYDFQNGYMDLDMNGSFSLDDIKKLPFAHESNILNGETYGKIKITKTAHEYLVKADLLLKKDNIDLSYLTFPESENTSDLNLIIDAKIHPNGINNLIKLDTMMLKGNEIDINIKGYIAKNEASLWSNTFIVNKNKMTFKYQLQNKKITVNVKGDYLNLSEFKFKSIPKFDKQKKINIFTNFNKVLLKNNVYIEGSILNLNEDILASTFNASFENGGYVSSKVNQFGFDVTSNNAGSLLKALNITNSIRHGELSFHVDLNNDLRTKPGILVINQFFVVKASILTNLLSLASFTGLLDVLNGDGIRFSKFVAPIKYADDIIYFEESWAEGDALGISFKGPVNFMQEEMILHGTIVPIYKLNKLIWKIPIIGKIITGGKSRGILAASYTIKKQAGKTSINVDPLSTLTPTLLQRVFDIFN